MWTRVTERMREFITKVGCGMLKRTVCKNFITEREKLVLDTLLDL